MDQIKVHHLLAQQVLLGKLGAGKANSKKYTASEHGHSILGQIHEGGSLSLLPPPPFSAS